MKLEKFKEKNPKKKTIIILLGGVILLLAGIYLYQTFAIFFETQEFNIIKGQVPNQKYDVMLSYNIIDDFGNKTFQETIPEGRDWGVTIECDHGAVGKWDYNEWGPDIRNLSDSRTKCSLNFKKPKLLDDLLKGLSRVTSGDGLYEVSHDEAEITYTTDTTAIHNLKQTELRYAGKNPNNYIKFNDELWRIIGLVNTPEGIRVKIIRKESIGSYSWDSSASDINVGYGVNEWNNADLMKLLNPGYEKEAVGGSLYWNKTSGNCYKKENNQIAPCDFSNIGLTDTAKNMIDTVTWNLGSNIESDIISFTPVQFYNVERGNVTGKICSSEEDACNDLVERKLAWSGRVGLMYPSDYGYATSDRTCLFKSMDSIDEWSSSCYDNNWLNKEDFQWTITSRAHYNSAFNVFSVRISGIVISNMAFYGDLSFPSVYLKNNVKVGNGNGTLDSPYELL